jgi:hypothetical protein
VIDLKRFFGLPPSDLTDLNRLVVLQHGGAELGVLADRIVGVALAALAELQARRPADRTPPACAASRRALGRCIDSEKLMNDPKMVVDESAVPDAAREREQQDDAALDPTTLPHTRRTPPSRIAMSPAQLCCSRRRPLPQAAPTHRAAGLSRLSIEELAEIEVSSVSKRPERLPTPPPRDLRDHARETSSTAVC